MAQVDDAADTAGAEAREAAQRLAQKPEAALTGTPAAEILWGSITRSGLALAGSRPEIIAE